MRSTASPQIRFSIFLMAVLAAFAFPSCQKGPETQNTAASAKPDEKNAQTANATAKNAAPPTAKVALGSIEVTSVPSGARVLLIAVDASGASEPQPHGLTPTTITNLGPGTYTVDIEMPGYRYFQTKVEVKENVASKVKAILKK